MKTGEIIGLLAQQKGLNLRQLAIKAEMPYNTLYAIVKRKSSRVDTETLQRIATALGVDVHDLTGLTPFMKESAIPPAEPTMAEIEQEAATLGMTVVEYLLSKPETREVGKQYQVLLKRAEKHDNKARIDIAFKLLNNDGQKKAAERVEELTEIPKYQRKSLPEE